MSSERLIADATKIAQDLFRQNLPRTRSLLLRAPPSQPIPSALERRSDIVLPFACRGKLTQRSKLRVAPIAALPRPFRRTPGRLSRGYQSQEAGLEIDLRAYRPTIFVLHRGRWGTGEFRRQPFSDPGFVAKRSCALDEANHLRLDCCAFQFTATPQNPQIGPDISLRVNRENTYFGPQ